MCEEVFSVELVVNRSKAWCVHSFQLTIITDITRPKSEGPKEDGESVLTAGHLLQALPRHVLYNCSEWGDFLTAHVVPGLPSEWLQADIALSAKSSGSMAVLIGSLMTEFCQCDGSVHGCHCSASRLHEV